MTAISEEIKIIDNVEDNNINNLIQVPNCKLIGMQSGVVVNI